MKRTDWLSKRVSSLDAPLNILEINTSILSVALFLALLLILLGTLYLRPAFEPTAHGNYYAQLAADPFPAENPNAYRLLTPLLAYLVGLRGDRIIYLNLFFALLLLAAIYYFHRKKAYQPSLAFGLAMMMASTMPTLFTLYFGGYTDSTTYFLVYLSMIFIRRPVIFWLCVFFGLLNRESAIFLLPFFFLFYWQSEKSFRKIVLSFLLGSIAVLGCYLLFRSYVGGKTLAKHSVTFYLAPLMEDPFYWLRQLSRSYLVGLFSAFKFYWVLPIIGTALAAKKRNYFLIALILAPVLCAAAQSIIAVDTTRMITMSFPALLVSAKSLRDEVGDHKLAASLFILGALNLLTPNYYVTSNQISTIR